MSASHRFLPECSLGRGAGASATGSELCVAVHADRLLGGLVVICFDEVLPHRTSWLAGSGFRSCRGGRIRGKRAPGEAREEAGSSQRSIRLEGFASCIMDNTEIIAYSMTRRDAEAVGRDYKGGVLVKAPRERRNLANLHHESENDNGGCDARSRDTAIKNGNTPWMQRKNEGSETRGCKVGNSRGREMAQSCSSKASHVYDITHALGPTGMER